MQHTHPGDEEVIAEEAEVLGTWHLPGQSETPSVHLDPEPGYGSTSTTRRGSRAPTPAPAPALESALNNGQRILKLPEGVEGVFEPTAELSRGSRRGRETSKNTHRLMVDELSAKYMVPIRRGIMCAFLTRDGELRTSRSAGQLTRRHADHHHAEDYQGGLASGVRSTRRRTESAETVWGCQHAGAGATGRL